MMTLNSASVAGLLLTLSGLAAYELTQETSKSVTLKSTVKILCTAQDDRYYISWYQQKPGGAPKFLLRNNERAPGLPSRFTYTDSNNQDYLNINGIEAEDEAVYYCGCAPSADDVSFGQGTKVVISDHPASPPSLALLAPSQSVQSGDEVSVVCMARGFHPDSVALSWAEDGSAVAGPDVQTGSSQRQPDGTFSQSSILKLNAGRWSSGRTYTCSLTHPALTSTLTKSVSVGQCS
ncbi:immunoglobulin lambda-1 light chain-like isoform X1 [Pygocentrus nattereri]|uniref:immunoglobulin lambda-1 light chain-like isoform X1 n=1 Tax=Pygocentrus nattereri TaxID=42514 RepID=UPI001890CBC9|nr:immunoglobulin lambda-1 light chain-like isoform X1 [Pygocentrus nattereri]